jgi:SSS family solute:Na+ symporter/sodium/pantothenate symporter
MISKDIYAQYVNPDASQRRQVQIGKVWEIIVIAVVLYIAWNPPATLYAIFVLKFELIAQLAPAFILGLYWNRLSALPVFLGMLAGALLAGGMTVFGVDDLYGIGGGMLGLLLNVVICVVGSLLVPASQEEVEHAQEATAVPAYTERETV